jgi:acyl carrier protein
MNFIEKILFEKFPEMPKAVRIAVYLTVLLLYVYLLLVPRFINGHLAIEVPGTGKSIDYRGAELRVNVEGRTYKFTANEDGFWSIPIVSKLPEGVEFEVRDPDHDTWHCVTLSVADVWGTKSHKLKVTNASPFVKVVSQEEGKRLFSGILQTVTRWLSSDSVEAAEIRLPANVRPSVLTAEEKASIQQSVIGYVANITGKKAHEVSLNFSLLGPKGPSYVQRIQIIKALEAKFNLTIPDEHWKSLGTVGELADYIEKRQVLVRSKQNLPRDWEGLQKTFSPNERPLFIR